MIYIYEHENKIVYTKNKPESIEKYMVLKRMIPIPQKRGYKAILKADFKNNTCWFELKKTLSTDLKNKEEKINLYEEIEKIKTAIVALGGV